MSAVFKTKQFSHVLNFFNRFQDRVKRMKVHQFIVDKAPQLFKADMKASKTTLSQPTDEGNCFSVAICTKVHKKINCPTSL